MDRLTQKQRSKNMSRIKGKNTGLEKMFRKYIISWGIKGYKLHAQLTGKPDLYFPKPRLAIFIDGCFWHGCPRCGSLPATNRSFWKNKIETNKLRDKTVRAVLRKSGIKVVRFWGHEITRNPDRCLEKLTSIFIGSVVSISR